MRLIATEAGVSVGNAYYWFPGKDHLVQELYQRLQVEHRTAVAERLQLGGTLEQRLRGTWLAGIEVFAPYRSFGAGFVQVAIRPGDAASPFSEASTEARRLAVGLLEDVVQGARPQVQGPVAAKLPELLLARLARRHALLGLRHLSRRRSDPAPGRAQRPAAGPAGPAEPAAGAAGHRAGRARPGRRGPAVSATSPLSSTPPSSPPRSASSVVFSPWWHSVSSPTGSETPGRQRVRRGSCPPSPVRHGSSVRRERHHERFDDGVRRPPGPPSG